MGRSGEGRAAAVRAIAAVVALGGGLALATGARADGPPRKPGLWIATLTGGALGTGTRVESCVGPGAVMDASAFTQNRAMTNCSTPPVVTRVPGGANLHMVCSPGGPGMVMDTTAVATGDFQNHYRVHSTTRISSTGGSMPAMAPMSVDVDVVWSGACPGDLHPGDARMGGRIYHSPPH